MIDISSYPKHDFIVADYFGFGISICAICKYKIVERYEGDVLYLRTYINNILYQKIDRNIKEYKKQLLTCNEVLIKNIIE